MYERKRERERERERESTRMKRGFLHYLPERTTTEKELGSK